MRHLLFSSIILLLIASILTADSNLTCQYRYNTTEEIESLNMYDRATDQFITNKIEPSKIEEGSPTSGSPICRFELHNNYDVPLSMRVMFRHVTDTNSGPGRYIEYFYDNTVDILPHDFQRISVSTGVSSHSCNLDRTSIKIILKENNATYVKYEKENITTEHCQECPPHSGNICLNDGVSCNNSIDCGSGFCIMGSCSSNKNCCYLNDCQCETNEIQCECHSCVKRRALPPGTKTLCNLSEECANGLMDEVGVCKKLNNGEVCTSANLCEGGYCIRGKCTGSPDILGDVLSGIGHVFASILPIFAFLLIVGLIALTIFLIYRLIHDILEIEKIKLEMKQKFEIIQSLNDEIDELMREQNLVKLRINEISKNERLEREKRLREIRELETKKMASLGEIADLNQQLKKLTKQVAFEVIVKKGRNLPTKKGELVQSEGEQLIADFLYENGIDYEYDMRITLKSNGIERWIRPDFYLTSFNLFIEYWGMKGDPKYDKKMADKMRLYSELNTRLIQIERHELSRLDEILKSKLNSNGCEID